MCIYQYLARRTGHEFKVSNTGFFAYGNAQATDIKNFKDQLDFDTSLLPYIGDESWVEPVVVRAYKCLQSNTMPLSSNYCDYCQYFARRLHHEKNNQAQQEQNANNQSNTNVNNNSASK